MEVTIQEMGHKHNFIRFIISGESESKRDLVITVLAYLHEKVLGLFPDSHLLWNVYRQLRFDKDNVINMTRRQEIKAEISEWFPMSHPFKLSLSEFRDVRRLFTFVIAPTLKVDNWTLIFSL
jgi:hypothetical protein